MAKAKDKTPARQEQEEQRMRIEYRAIDALAPYADNPRKNDAAVPRMASLIAEFGFKVPVIIRSSGEVIDGHLRLKAARALNMKEVPVVIADEWTPEQVRAFRLAVNRSAEWAEWDLDKLRAELDALEQEGVDLDRIGFADLSPEEMTALEAPAAAVFEEGTQETADVPAKPAGTEEGKQKTADVPDQSAGTTGQADSGEQPSGEPPAPVSHPGDVWLLGPHRLVCGDSALGWCDTIIRRWQSFTGREATLEADGRTFAAVAGERG